MPFATASTTEKLLESYRRNGDLEARDQLVRNYGPLVRRLCARFHFTAHSQEDLFQVGVIGLLHAIDRFDSSYGNGFSCLAIPEVLGAILNYLRDHDSLMKVPRALRRNRLRIDKESTQLAAGLGRWPTVAELSEACGLSEDEVYAAMEFARVGDARSLDERIHSDDSFSGPLSELVGREDHEFELMMDRLTLADALDTLPDRERAIVILRNFGGMTQKQVSERIGYSQMHVSRLERSALLKLRVYLEGDTVQSTDDRRYSKVWTGELAAVS